MQQNAQGEDMYGEEVDYGDEMAGAGQSQTNALVSF